MDTYLYSAKTTELIRAILSLKTVAECQRFLRDLCTPEEIQDMGDRWEIARLLAEGKTYRSIAKATNVSTTTVARVANWLENGMGGYQIALKRVHGHISPRSAGKGLH